MAIDLTQIDWEEYNPFKMWGAWIGGGLGLIISYFNIGATYLHKNFLFLHWFILGSPVCDGPICPTLYSPLYTFPQGYLLLIVLGFFVGWGIHSLVRRLK